MSWKPNILTQNIISNFIEDLLDFLPEQLGIEEIISACEVISLDPQGLGVATFPRPILCRVNNYYQLVQYRGGLPGLAVGDFVTVVHLREGNRYEVLGMGGSGGIAPDPNGLPCEVSVVRGCTITPYADPDDAFTNANMAGDVILVPEGTWTLSASHTMTNGTSIVGLGGHPESCILQATASVGVDLIQTGDNCFVFNVRIRYVSAAGAARTALHITDTSEALLVDAYCQETGGEPWGIDVDGGRAELCTAYAIDQTTGKPIGIEVESGGHIFRCEGRALHATVGEAVGINLSIGSNSARWCRGEGQDIAGTSYGISSDTGTNIIEWCEADGETTDIYVASGTLSLFSCQYASTAGAGAIAYLPGDRDVMDLDGDTYIRALATDDQIDVVVNSIPAATWTALRLVLNEGFAFDTALELTIAAGVITRTQVYHTVDTQDDDPTDDLDTINGGVVADILIIRAEDDARTIVVKHNVGNIWLIGEADISLEDTEDHLHLIYDGSTWCSLGDGFGAGGGGVHNLLSATHPDTDPQVVNQGSLVVGDATPEWTELVVGIAHAILKVNAGGTDPAWVAFDWDDIAAAAGADMVHDHSAAGEGGEVPLASLGSYIQGNIMKGGGADWDTLVIGAARFLLTVNAGGTEPEWLAFDWDVMGAAAGADMVHDHSAAGEGGEVPLTSLGSYTQGDIIYGGAADWQDLAIGAIGNILTVNGAGTEPVWAAAGGAAHNLLSATHLDTDPQAVTQGSLVVGDATPDWTELVVGAALDVLRVNAGGTDPEWAALNDAAFGRWEPLSDGALPAPAILFGPLGDVLVFWVP